MPKPRSTSPDADSAGVYFLERDAFEWRPGRRDRTNDLTIRRMRDDELEHVVALWRRSREDSQPWLEERMGYGTGDDLKRFRDHVVTRQQVWLAVEAGQVAGLLALAGGDVDQLYVDPARQRRGVGTALLNKAKQLFPDGLSLYTHQRNSRARAFYEGRGFRSVAFGMSPAPENEPDVKYAWEPAGNASSATTGSPLRRSAAVLAAAAAILALLLLLAREPIDVGAYLRRASFSTLAFAALFGLALYFERATRWAFTQAERAPVWLWAVGVFVACVVAEAVVLEGVPHTSDEAAYQFQAKALAQGRLGFTPPPRFEFFDFVHLSDAGGTWHGIMNPGWPALLAPAMRLGVPQLMNPLLAASTLLLLYGALRRTPIGECAARLCALGLAVSPFFVFLGATAMSHTANLFVFALFVYAWVRQHEAPQLGWAALAGLALALGATIRPLDTAVAAAPFGIWQVAKALREPEHRIGLFATGCVAATGVIALLAYNAALTGSALVFPQEIHFERLYPGQRFGFGFGADMGTVIHGPEWPGYYPSDAARVTSQRLLVWFEDVHGLPLVLLAGLLAFARPRRDGPWATALFASAAAVVLVYLGHFYHGIAYGSRHYALALPGVLAVLAIPAARALEAGGSAARRARAACVAIVLYALLFATPPLVRTYSADYRQASGAIRAATEQAGLHDALVFVHADRWGWKSGFPLNDYPLEQNDVLYARDFGERNGELQRLFPDRRSYLARIGADGRAHLRRLAGPTPATPPGPATTR